MATLQEIESQVAALSDQDFAAFREWFNAFQAEAWDKQLEADIDAGKLDALAGEALREFQAGKIRPF